MAAAPLVLIVDDEPDILESLRDLIEGALGYATLAARTGPEAMHMLAALDPRDVDLLIADYRMHPVNGLDLVQDVRHLHSDLPTLLCTGYADLEVAIEAVNRAHVSRFLSKPLDPTHFLDVVRSLVDGHRAARARGDALHRASGLPLDAAHGAEAVGQPG